MTLTTLVPFLLGGRQAIVYVAGCSGATGLGAVFVLSAGFAREYDAEDLLHQPWHVLLPMAASLVTSLLLFAIVYAAASKHAVRPIAASPAYRRFLTVYWMTAPLAWIYAIPVEQFLSAGNAVRANLWFLGLVSLWRVLLITRCVSVLLGPSYPAALLLVLFFADSLALSILSFTPLPIFNIMGGIQLTESEAILRETACTVQFFGGVTWPIWLIAAMVILGLPKRDWVPTEFATHSTRRVSKPLWVLAVCSLIVWTAVLPFSQPPQQLRRSVETDLLEARVDRAVQTMSSAGRDAFPPHWDPPPWPGYGHNVPPLNRVLEVVSADEVAGWVRSVYLAKFASILEGHATGYDYWRSMEADDLRVYVRVFRELPAARMDAERHSQTFVSLWQHHWQEDLELHAVALALLDSLGVAPPPPESVTGEE
jgi:hypothetical protein